MNSATPSMHHEGQYIVDITPGRELSVLVGPVVDRADIVRSVKTLRGLRPHDTITVLSASDIDAFAAVHNASVRA